ncbi:alpha/beta fold hydrolase [Nocardiopsis alkaliphila]|uniref:alpha/beta fold hydrolase n=1 Tax=Nocardiopsis alkaliphila TaxID=225762 RepID=UPI0003759712|nr:alpha/beta hydrolase [Nocardiopsis alkaliphila]
MGTLAVSGAELHYEISGSGPLLLLIPGGTDDARDFAGLIPLLETSFSVLTYDCRGVSRSRLSEPTDRVSVETQAQDAWNLLKRVDGGPAYVFGTSGGGQIGLELTARHPVSVMALVVHEPPVARFLPEWDTRRSLVLKVCEIYRTHGAERAMEVFVAGSRMKHVSDPARHAPESPRSAVLAQERAIRMRRNLDHFFSRVLSGVVDYRPDTDVLKETGVRIMVGVGQTSREQFAHDTGLALAARLGSTPTVFPGGHAGFVTHPVGFADRLRGLMEAD